MNEAPIRIGIVGLGKIAHDQHIPAIAADPRFALVAGASRNARLPDKPSYPDLERMLAAHPELDAVALCTPPNVRRQLAATTLSAGKHLMLEKPPAASLGEVELIRAWGRQAGRTVFATWHSRHAPAVEPLRAWLADRTLTAAQITWKEDVRRWHPGQEWVWDAGSFGVFDPGINALSILTRIVDQQVLVDEATLAFPANRQAPIAATMALATAKGAKIEATFDWRQTGPQTWDIELQTSSGRARLSRGGARLDLDGELAVDSTDREYPNLYDHFARLIAAGESDIDAEPLRIVADAFMIGARETVEPFAF
jgi:D-galactose 1-dehydrogenase